MRFWGWFALAPPTVAAMAIVMVVKDDPNASIGQAIVLTVIAGLFASVAIGLYRRLFSAACRLPHCSEDFAGRLERRAKGVA